MFKQLNTGGKIQLKIYTLKKSSTYNTLTTLYCEQHTVKRTLGLQHNVTHDKVKKKAQTEQANAEGQLPRMLWIMPNNKEQIKHQKYGNHNQNIQEIKNNKLEHQPQQRNHWYCSNP